MAYSYVEYTANGSTDQFDITFSYIDRTHVKVYVDNVEDTSFTFVNDSRIQTSSTPTNGQVVKIDRDTPVTSRLVDFQDGSVLTETDLDRSANQNFFIAQETTDEVASKLGQDNSGLFDANNTRIINVANPTANQDAVTKYYLENTWLSTANKTALTTVNDNISNINAVNSNASNINTVANDLNEAVSEIDTVANSITNVNTVGTNITDVNTVAANDSNITTVAGQNSNITTLAGISGNITTVAGISSNVTSVANDSTDIGTVATDISNVNTVAGSIANVNTAAGSIANINTVASDLNEAVSEIDTVATNITNVNTVGGAIANVNSVASNISNVNAVASNSTNINTVAGNNTNINTVAGQNANITTLAGISADITSVANISTDIQAVENKLTEIQAVASDLAEAQSEIDTVAASISNVDSVGTNIANVNTVAGISSNVTTVAGVSSNVTTVAGISANVTTVAGISSDVTSVAADATDIGVVAGQISPTNNISTLAGISSNISTVAGIAADVTAVAGDATDIGTVAGAATNIGTVASSISNVNTVASNISGVNSFAERYRVAATDPTTSLDQGDLVFNTGASALKYYDGSSWQTIVAGSLTDIVQDGTPQLGGSLDLNSNNITGTGNIDITGSGTFSGDLGIGKTPDASFSSYKALEIGNAGFLTSIGSGNENIFIGSNAYLNGSGSWTYMTTNESTYYRQGDGRHSWNYAPSGTADTAITFKEAMRIDASGNFIFNEDSNDQDFRVESNNNTHALFVDGGNDAVLVGKSTYNSIGTAGTEIRSIGLGIFTRDGSQPLILNRLTSDGDIVDFRKDGTIVGSIGTLSGDLAIGTGDVTLWFNDGGNNILPRGTSFGTNDNVIDLGNSSNRFNDAYFGGTVNAGALTLTSTDGGATAQPILKLFRNSATPADGDTLGQINFAGVNDNVPEEHVYAKIISKIQDASNATEDGILDIQTTVATSEGTSRIYIDSTEVVVNEASLDSDFRVESDAHTHALFVRGSDGHVGIGTNSLTERFVVISESDTTPIDTGFAVYRSVGDDKVNINAQGGAGNFVIDGGSTYIPTRFYAFNGTTLLENFRYDPGTTSMVFNEQSYDQDFRVESNNNASMLFVDGGTDRVGIGTSSPEGTFDTIGTGYFGVQNYTEQATQLAFVLRGDGVSGVYAPSRFNFYTQPGTTSNGIAKIHIKSKYGSSAESSELFTFTSNGRLGVNNSTPSQAIDVTGTVKATAFQGDGSALTGISGGKVAQVVSTTKTNTFSSSSTSFTDITGMSVSITPSATSSKILVLVNLSHGGAQNCYAHAKILRGTTSIAQGNTGSSNQSEATFPLQMNLDAAQPAKVHSSSMNYLDSPSSTSSLTYKVQVSSINFNGGGIDFRLNRPVLNDNNAGIGLYVSTITVMEILA